MSRNPLLQASQRTVRFVDAAVGVWVAVWVTVGLAVVANLHDLSELSATLETSSEALEQTAGGLRSFEGVPFVGDRIGNIADDVEETAFSARRNAIQSREDVRDLGWLVGLSILVIPSVPALAAYLPFRIQRVRDRRAVRRALADEDRRELVHRYLAERAVVNLPYHDLRQVSETPWLDLQEGRIETLAHAEMHRLGIERAGHDGDGG